MITLTDLSYTYPKTSSPAIIGATGEIPAGINLLLGENGAGKTTLLHLIAGLLTPSGGSITIDGATPSERMPEMMQSIYFVPDDMTLPCDTINEFARIHGCFYPTFDADMLADNLAQFGLDGNTSYHALSLGNRKKAQLAYALALKPAVLLLDEPANGLDISAKQALQQMFVTCIDETQTVLLSTHTTGELACLFDGVVMLNKARMLLSIPTWQLSERLSFTAALLPPSEPLYVEQRMGLFRAITKADGTATTDIDYPLLYTGLMSPARDIILNHLKTTNDNEL